MNNPILQQIQEQSRFEKIDYADSCLLRGCFDSASSEWNKSTIEQKVEALKVLINRDKVLTSTLVSKMLNYCNNEVNKGIAQEDVLLSLSKIIDYLLIKEKELTYV